MTTHTRALSIFILAAAILAGRAQTTPTAAASAPPPQLSPTEQAIQDIKNPASWMTWGGDLRVRSESFDSLLTLNPYVALHEQHYIRFRARVWTSLRPMEGLSFNVRLTDEAREWLRPAGYTPFRGASGMDWREGFIDNLNVQWKGILDQPLSATVGRQDIFLGDGWLMGDGTPQDGSWTYYLDAARVSYEFKEQHTLVEAIGIIQDAKDEAWMPTINNQNYYVTEQNEKGAILWVANKSLPAANFDAYFMYKQDNPLSSTTPGDPAPARGDLADIYTLGGRVSGGFAEHWKYSAEGAFQFGHKRDPGINDTTDPALRNDFRAISAFGVNSRISYLFKDEMNDQLTLSYEFLTGDDPDTHNDEMFDNLWGRWPRWSEIGLYSYGAETRVGNEANIHRIGPTWSFTPVKNLDFSASYYALFAQQEKATRGAGGVFAGNQNTPDHGLFRGHFLQAVLKYKFSKHVMAHLWAEFQFPGDYYVYRQPWYFLRPEVMFSF